jgi:GNAT superfamily N-acetyltransferase
MEHIIRECQEADLYKLVELCGKHAEYERTSFNPEGKVTALRDALFGSHPKLYCLIVEADKSPVGYASYTFDFSTWDAATFLHMDCLYIEPAYRNFGIGELLIKRLREIALTKGCINVQWQTPDFNVRAIKFYRRIGGLEKNKVRFFLNP